MEGITVHVVAILHNVISRETKITKLANEDPDIFLLVRFLVNWMIKFLKRAQN